MKKSLEAFQTLGIDLDHLNNLSINKSFVLLTANASEFLINRCKELEIELTFNKTELTGWKTINGVSINFFLKIK